MRLTDEQAPVAGEKLTVAVVKGQRLMSTEVLVGNNLTLVVGHEGIHTNAVALESKPLGRPLGQVVELDEFFTHQPLAKATPSLRLPRR